MYTIMIGALRPDECHSEMSSSLDDARAYLHAFARKAKPENAIANIGDYRAWVGNRDLQSVDLNQFPELRDRVKAKIVELDEIDEQAELGQNEFLPDIKVEPFDEGRAMVSSVAMQFCAPCKAEKLPDLVSQLCREYQDLVAADLVSKPTYNSSRKR